MVGLCREFWVQALGLHVQTYLVPAVERHIHAVVPTCICWYMVCGYGCTSLFMSIEELQEIPEAATATSGKVANSKRTRPTPFNALRGLGALHPKGSNWPKVGAACGFQSPRRLYLWTWAKGQGISS